MTPATHAYIGIAPCGCCHEMVAEIPEALDDVVASVTEMRREGYTVQRLTIDKAWARFHGDRNCPHREEKA